MWGEISNAVTMCGEKLQATSLSVGRSYQLRHLVWGEVISDVTMCEEKLSATSQ